MGCVRDTAIGWLLSPASSLDYLIGIYSFHQIISFLASWWIVAKSQSRQVKKFIISVCLKSVCELNLPFINFQEISFRRLLGLRPGSRIQRLSGQTYLLLLNRFFESLCVVPRWRNDKIIFCYLTGHPPFLFGKSWIILLVSFHTQVNVRLVFAFQKFLVHYLLQNKPLVLA